MRETGVAKDKRVKSKVGFGPDFPGLYQGREGQKAAGCIAAAPRPVRNHDANAMSHQECECSSGTLCRILYDLGPPHDRDTVHPDDCPTTMSSSCSGIWTTISFTTYLLTTKEDGLALDIISRVSCCPA